MKYNKSTSEHHQHKLTKNRPAQKIKNDMPLIWALNELISCQLSTTAESKIQKVASILEQYKIKLMSLAAIRQYNIVKMRTRRARGSKNSCFEQD